jgi:aryl-alcohol dehydrogenase-like predicted oxidoreductase
LSGDAYGPVELEEQRRVIARARILGIQLFDTADVYGAGNMERLLAEVLGIDAGVTIVTKIGTRLDTEPPRKCFEIPFLEQSLDACAARLRPRTLDLVLLHNPSVATLRKGDATAFLSAQCTAGRIRSWGVSAGSIAAAEAALDAGAPVLEMAFNVFWAKELRELEQRVKLAGTAVLARSILAHGLLAGQFSNERIFPRNDHRKDRWTADELRYRVRQLDAIRPLVRGEVTSLRAAAVRWVLGHENLISCAILGPRNTLQLDQLVRDAGREPPYLPLQSLNALEARLEDVGARS